MTGNDGNVVPMMVAATTDSINNNKCISIVPWLQVTLFKGADTNQILKHSKNAKGKDT